MFTEPGRVWMVFSYCQLGECDVIRGEAAALRRVQRVAAATGTELYLADDGAPPGDGAPLGD